MKRFLKWTGIVVLSLVLVFVISAFIMNSKSESRLTKIYDITPKKLMVNSDEASLENGKIWATSLCTSCHGLDFSGTDFFNEPDIAVIHAPNITSGKGGVGQFSDEDFVRIIRHGVKHDGTPALVMPSKDFSNMSDEDLADLIAYIKSLPPVDKEWSKPKTTSLAKILLSVGAFGDIINAETIDHKAVGRIKAPPIGATVEYGAYVVNVVGCRKCHGDQLNGGKDGDPNAPIAPNITVGGNLGNWTKEDFIKTIKSGTSPEGKALKNDFMPWFSFSKLDDERLEAVYKYLNSLPGKPDAEI